MELFLLFSEILNGSIMPAMLIVCGAVLGIRTKIFKILFPRRFIKTLAEAPVDKGTSPFGAMCCALAGTLGVGNIAGVATAISAGGAGAVLWMWIGALFSMSVKYGEVALAVKYRQSGESCHYGGAMYTIKNGLKRRLGRSGALLFGGVFSLLCIVNSLVTGNIVQSNSAAAVFPEIPKFAVGGTMAAALLVTAVSGREKISRLMSYLIPPLSGIYIFLSVSVIFRNTVFLPEIISEIVKSAFSVKAAVGGVAGVGIKEALRYGVTRGIFSNEAGCGTSPTAHASANVKSPHHQGCYGIFEVIADTPLLCSMTAFVILIADKKHGITGQNDGVPLTLEAFNLSLGAAAYYIIGVAVILFAFATIAAQLYYGSVALGYFTNSKIPYAIYVLIAVLAALGGSLVNVEKMWLCADIVVGLMTVVNVCVLFVMRREIGEISSENLK